MTDIELGSMEFDTVERINNADIINLVSWIDTGLRQFSRAPSSSRTDTQLADINIAKAWVARFKQYFEHFSTQPELYLPKASPKPKMIPAPPADIKIVQNPILQMLMYQLSHMRTELLYCESAERINGFHPQETAIVIKPWIEKQEFFLDEATVNLGNPGRTWMPEADIHEPGLNPGSPR